MFGFFVNLGTLSYSKNLQRDCVLGVRVQGFEALGLKVKGFRV